MKTGMLLLVSAVVLLVSPAVASPTHHGFDENLNAVFDLAHKYNQSLNKEIFVEDVSKMAEGVDRCQDKFFCKVYDILHKHFNKSEEEKKLVRNLGLFINRNASCTELRKDVTPTVIKPIPDLVKYLIDCIRYRNLNGTVNGTKP